MFNWKKTICVIVSIYVIPNFAIEVKESEENSTENVNININASLAAPPEVHVTEMTRITLPTNYFQELVLSEDNNSSNSDTKLRQNDSFNPSPQIPMFEFNKNPVPLAYPEAKHVYTEASTDDNLRPYLPPAPVPMPNNNHNNNNNYPSNNNYNNKNNNNYPSNNQNGYLPPNNQNNGYLPPSDQNNGYLPPSDQNNGYLPPNNQNSFFPPNKNGGFSSQNNNNDYLPPKPGQTTGSGALGPTAWSSSTPKHNVNFPESQKPIHAKEDPPYPFHFSSPSAGGATGPSGKEFGSYYPQSGYGHGHESSYDHHGVSPWKKVIHFLTALLPIGLFLTALTPTVLTVTPVINNDTSKSSRLVDVDNTLIDLLEGRAEDTTGCHQTRLLCEAAAKGREPGATNLQKSLWLIASQAYEETRGPKEFLKLFRAIKGNKCKELKCDDTKFKD